MTTNDHEAEKVSELTASPAVPADVQLVTGIPGMIGLSALTDAQGHQKNALVIHFDHEITDQDRQNIIRAQNAAISLSDYQRLAAENERLTKERGVLLDINKDLHDRHPLRWKFALIDKAEARAEAAESKLAEAVKVLALYADHNGYFSSDGEPYEPNDDHPGRAAEAFLASLTRAEGEA